MPKITQGEDFLGNTLVEGDIVAYTSTEAMLGVGIVTGFTPKGLRLLPVKIRGTLNISPTTRYTRKPDGSYDVKSNEYINRQSHVVVRLTAEYADIIGLPPSFIAEIISSK